MEIKNLRCFLAVAEKLNFSRAAESMYISQPALSQRINALEEELGVRLFLRNHQQVFLTAAGQKILPEAREIIEQMDRLPELAKNSSDASCMSEIKLAIALDSSLPQTMMEELVSVFSEFYRKYPHVAVSIDSVEYNNYDDMLLTEEADLCFVGLKESEVINPAFSSVLVQVDPMVLAFTGGEYLTNIQLLTSREVVLLEGERWNAVFLGYLRANQINPRIRMIRGGPALCVNLMQDNTITFMPKSFFDSIYTPSLNYRNLKVQDGEVFTNLIWDKNNLNPALQMMINCFRAEEEA